VRRHIPTFGRGWTKLFAVYRARIGALDDFWIVPDLFGNTFFGWIISAVLSSPSVQTGATLSAHPCSG
jgi:hypothetical protein